MKNFIEIKKKIIQTNSGFQVNNSYELADKITALLKDKTLIKDNVFFFPGSLSDAEREFEAVLFAAADPLDIDTIETKIS